jgi:mono/diheme cytochrome c family protein
MLSALLLTLLVACEATQTPVQTPQEIFRYDTFGDEAFWTDTLQMHEVIASAVDPQTALSVGLKVDSEALPEGILESADMSDPATTVELLRLDAVVGVRGTFDESGELTAVGVTCALCHSTVDDSVAAGIGRRLDGWPNRDLDPGLIISLSPFFDDELDLRAQLQSWGPGFYDPYWNLDGISDPVLIPPAYGLRAVPLETFTGEGPVSYWNAYVAVTQMHGQGTFVNEELGIEIRNSPDLVTPKLPALRQYQFSLEPPTPPAGSFDAGAANRGEAIFSGKANCSTCHSGSSFSDAATGLHAPAETGMDPAYALRGTTGAYRTTPLRGAWQHPPYFHDGSAATLADVVAHYDTQLGLGLSAQEQADLVEYLKSL